MNITRRLLFIGVFCVPTFSSTAENQDDTYLYRDKCPVGDIPTGENHAFAGGDIYGGKWIPYDSKNPKSSQFWADKWSFAQCNCTSYVASKLNEAWHGEPSFGNNYYDIRWGDAKNWREAAESTHHIGITGAQDDFVFDKKTLNGGFKGDVVYWSHLSGWGHVAFAETDATPGPNGRGIGCITFSDYNRAAINNYGKTTMCRKSDGSFPDDFPDAFIHITQNHEYCLEHLDDCDRFLTTLASSSIDGAFGGSDSSNPPPISGTNSLSELPNLVMRDVYLEDANKNRVYRLHIGEKGYCHMSVINNGVKKAKGIFENRCWLSDGKKFDGKNDAEDIGKEDMDDLDDGKSRVSHEDFYAPEYPTIKNLVGCADANEEVLESNEKDNCNVGDHAIKQEYVFEVWSNPNLTTTAISLIGEKTTLAVNESFGISSTTANPGENFGPAYVYIGYFIDGTFVGQNQIRRSNMKGGMSKTEEISISEGITTTGVHEIKACADYTNGIIEINETDNCMTLLVTVTDPNASHLNPNPELTPIPLLPAKSDDDDEMYLMLLE